MAPYLHIVQQNRGKGESHGFEIAAEWYPIESLRVSASYSYIGIDIHDVNSNDANVHQHEDTSPNHRIVVRTHWDLTDELQFNTAVIWNDNIRWHDVPSYVRVDLQLRWHPFEDLEVGLGIKNLLDDRHPEWGGHSGLRSTEVERTAYLWLDFSF